MSIKKVYSKYKSGFTGIEIVIALAIIGAISGGLVYVFKNDIIDFSKKPEIKETQQTDTIPAKNPFPTRPIDEPELPKEQASLPMDNGEPIVSPEITTAGEWHGNFTVTSPEECIGVVGGWEALLSDVNGLIGGNFTTNLGINGNVSGSRSGTTAEWGVGGSGSGVSFKGNISGNTISGSFNGSECPTGERTKGNFFGGRIVE